MRVLIDSHALLWAVDNPSRLGAQAALVLSDPQSELFVSVASVWELSIKTSLSKLTLSAPFRTWITQSMATLNAILLPISIDDADIQATLPFHHRDPFDRLLVAQTQLRQLSIVSSDVVFDLYGIPRIWS